jgi:chromosome segregation ATPase
LPATLGGIVPSDATDVPSNENPGFSASSTGQQRSKRLRAKRGEAGLAQVSGWVPKERRAYARKVLEALARGANSLPPDPEQAAALEATRIEADRARAAEADAQAALVQAKEHGQVLTAQLDATRAEIEAEKRQRQALEAERDAARAAEAAEREKAQATATEAQAAARIAQDAQEQATEALGRAEKAETVIRQARSLPGLRGRLVRWLARDALE